MSLTARLSAFFLVALAVVLAGFSAAVYLLAQTYLSRQAEERLEAALEVLAAAAEVTPEGVEWDPHERQLSIGHDDAVDQVRWVVHDERGRPLDRSRNLGGEDLWPAGETGPSVGEGTSLVVLRQGERWRLVQRRLHPQRSGTAAPPRGQRQQEGEHGQPDEDREGENGGDSRHDPTPRRGQEPPDRVHAQLVLTAGLSLQTAEETLRRLAAALTGLSLGLLLAATLLGRWLCRRALAPVTRMAATAGSMSAANLGMRLPPAGTGDELEALRLAFNGLLGRLEEAFERQRRFTGDASHQLRTPLTVMLGHLEVALRRARSAEEYREVLAVAHGQAVRLRQIVEMLLFLARADAEARLPRLETTDLRVWLNDHLRQWSDHPRRSDLRVEVSPAPTYAARVQPALLGQLLDNLLDNACKYSEPATPIVLRLAGQSSTVTLAVEDAGSGIAAEDMPHIFEPFYRARSTRHRGLAGVGLGLAVAQRIATALGGTIDVLSEPDRGSRFVLRLPAANIPQDQAETSAR